MLFSNLIFNFRGTQRYRQIAKLAGTEDATDPILLNTDVRRAIMGVEYMAKSFKEEEFYERSKAEWKYVAFVLGKPSSKSSGRRFFRIALKLSLDHCLLYVFILTCLVGSAAIFGSNCMDLILAAWHTDHQDGYLNTQADYPGQDFCFRFLSEGMGLQTNSVTKTLIAMSS